MTTSTDSPGTGTAMSYAQRLAQDKGVLAALGIRALPGDNDEWRLSLLVTADRVNAGGKCHGGFLFALADTALAYTLGAAGFKPATVDANITYLKPALLNDEVVANVEIVRIGRTQGVVDVRLRRSADDKLLAVFRGTCVNLA